MTAYNAPPEHNCEKAGIANKRHWTFLDIVGMTSRSHLLVLELLVYFPGRRDLHELSRKVYAFEAWGFNLK
jgi:hypothetical protein